MTPACHPEKIGPYRIAGILGHGGMGTVYRALVPETGRVVALKLLDPSEPLRETLGMGRLQELFATEVGIISSLRHPNIIEVLDSGHDLGRPFFTMEHFCANLGMMIGENYLVEEPCRRVPPDRILGYGSQILAGLSCMHGAGVIHRDIKPFNMLLADDGTVKICDFGMARRQGDTTDSAPGMNVGSPYYTAPEQLSTPEGVDGRADLYATGVLLYRMLTGELPSMKGFMLSQVNPLYDPVWDAFFATALSWQPKRRFRDGDQMRRALLRLQPRWNRGQPGGPAPGDTARPPLRSSPLRVTGNEAREAFGVDRLWQPRIAPCRHFIVRDTDMVLDRDNRLLWQHRPSDQPVDRETALALVAAMNNRRLAGIGAWRLPTVNELLSLARSPSLPPADDSNPPFPATRDWFWSCDRRSATTSWYVNIALGYAGWQNNGCRFSVCAVAST